MSKKVFADAFFTQFHEFLGELTKVFPDDPDFPAYDTGLSFLQMMNPAMVISEFKNHVLPYETTLREKNSDFFMNHKFEDVVSADMSMDAIILKLKNLWASLTGKSQDAIWNYIILLVDIVKRC
jgi:hypothetical protein